MISALIVFIGLSLLIIVHELGHFWAAKYFDILVEEFGFGFPPAVFKKKVGETIYSFNSLPFGGFVKLYGELEGLGKRSFMIQKPWKRAVVVVAGVVMNFLAGWVIFSAIFWIGMPPVVFVDSVTKDSPAHVAGLQSGDIIEDWPEIGNLIVFINENKGKEINLKIRRGQDIFDVAVMPRINPPVGEGALGISLHGGGLPSRGFFSGLYNGWLASWAIVWGIFAGLYQVFLSPQNVVGPIGILNIAVTTGKAGVIYVLQLVGLISINLAVLNILPIPALDGGRLLFIIIEKLRGKPFSSKTEIRANTIGFALLITLIVVVTLNDIIKIL